MTALRMKVDGTTPDEHSYHYLVEALTRAGEWREAWAVIDDAKLSGHKPDASLYNLLLHVSYAITRSLQPDTYNDLGCLARISGRILESSREHEEGRCNTERRNV